MLADIERWKRDLAQYSSHYVGQTLVYLNGTFEECRFRECNLGNMICDAMVRTSTCTSRLLSLSYATASNRRHPYDVGCTATQRALRLRSQPKA